MDLLPLCDRGTRHQGAAEHSYHTGSTVLKARNSIEYSARNRMTFPRNWQLISKQKMGWKDRKKPTQTRNSTMHRFRSFSAEIDLGETDFRFELKKRKKINLVPLILIQILQTEINHHIVNVTDSSRELSCQSWLAVSSTACWFKGKLQ